MKFTQQQLIEKFIWYEDKFSEIKSKFESEVVYTEYYKGAYYEVSPFSYQREGFRKGKNIKNIKKIKNKNNIYEYDFNKKNKILIIREGVSFDNMFYHSFLHYDDDCLLIIRYDYSNELQNIRFYFYNDRKKIHEMYSRGRSGGRFEKYIYNNDVLESITINQFDEKGDNAHSDIVHTFIYNEDGSLNSILKHPYNRSYLETIYLSNADS